MTLNIHRSAGFNCPPKGIFGLEGRISCGDPEMGLLLLKELPTVVGFFFMQLCELVQKQLHKKSSAKIAKLLLSGWSRLRRDDLHKVGVAELN